MTEKLQKVLARAGLGSRREMEGWISEGRIEVNGRVATLGDRVGAEDSIVVDGDPLETEARDQAPTRILLYHKPIGEVCTRSDPEGRPTVFENLPDLDQGRWISIGRLDINTSGLLLFTNDGALAHRLMHPSSKLEREYVLRLNDTASDEAIERLKRGVRLPDGMARFNDIVDGGGRGQNHWYYVVVSEGRNRLVRRLWESQGYQINRLKRVRFGPIALATKPRAGHTIERKEWVDWLR